MTKSGVRADDRVESGLSRGHHIIKQSVLIYGTKIIPLLKIKTVTTITTISAGTTFKSFIVVPLVRLRLIDGKRTHKFSRLIPLRDVPCVTYGRSEPTQLINAAVTGQLLFQLRCRSPQGSCRWERRDVGPDAPSVHRCYRDSQHSQTQRRQLPSLSTGVAGTTV